MQRQVDSHHYRFTSYLTKERWASLWHQLDEVTRLEPERALEIGPGSGVFSAMARMLGIAMETLDIDPALEPDHLASVLEMPFGSNEFDVVCAFQVLEHLPYEKSLEAFARLADVAASAVVISLPDASVRWPFFFRIPGFGTLRVLLPRPRLFRPVHVFDGEHYWEIGKAGFSMYKIIDDLQKKAPSLSLVRNFRVFENPYHRFFVFLSASSVTAAAGGPETC
mgnify:CR=1 FL=1